MVGKNAARIHHSQRLQAVDQPASSALCQTIPEDCMFKLSLDISGPIWKGIGNGLMGIHLWTAKPRNFMTSASELVY